MNASWSDAGRAFLEQNEEAAKTLTLDQVSNYAEHHCGGLYVLGAFLPGDRYAKMHDTWGPGDAGDGPVIVHTYSLNDDDDQTETVENFETGREAFDRFVELVEA